MKKLSQHFERILALFLAVLMGAMVIDVSWQVLTRFILANPSSFTEELARFLLMWIGLMGAAYAYRKHSHLSLDLALQSANEKRRIILLRLIHSVSFIFAATTMVFGGAQLMALTLSLQQTSASLGIPMGYVYSCIPISGLLICWFAMDNILHPVPSELPNHDPISANPKS